MTVGLEGSRSSPIRVLTRFHGGRWCADSAVWGCRLVLGQKSSELEAELGERVVCPGSFLMEPLEGDPRSEVGRRLRVAVATYDSASSISR